MTGDKKVGRPPRTDKDGKPIRSVVVSVNLPINLVNYIDDQKIDNPKFNVSEYITQLIQKNVDDGMCQTCYGTNLEQNSMGLTCLDCTKRNMASSRTGFDSNLIHYISFKNCDNCGTPYDLWNKSKWGGDPRRRGCSQASCFETGGE